MRRANTFVGNYASPAGIVGCTFRSGFDLGELNAKYAVGSNVSTYASSRGANNPHTYFDSLGIMQLVTTSDIGVFPAGYYDLTGFHLYTHRGLKAESASTNNFASGTIDTNSAWNVRSLEYGGVGRWSVAITNSGAVTVSISNDSVTAFGNKSAQIEITNDGAIGASDVKFRNVDAISITNTEKYTISFWIKTSVSKTGIALKAIDRTDGTTTRGLDTTFSTLANTWIKIEKTWTANATDTIEYHWWFGDNGLYTINLESFQTENNPFATSPIPTTTAALTRNLETNKYETAGNRTAATESCVVKLATQYDSATNTLDGYISSTDTKRRELKLSASGNNIRITPNTTDGSSNTSGGVVVINTETTIGWSVQATGNPNMEIYQDGVSKASDDTDFTENAWGTYFWVGSRNDGILQLNGVILGIAFFNRVLTPAEHLILHTQRW